MTPAPTCASLRFGLISTLLWSPGAAAAWRVAPSSESAREVSAPEGGRRQSLPAPVFAWGLSCLWPGTVQPSGVHLATASGPPFPAVPLK